MSLEGEKNPRTGERSDDADRNHPEDHGLRMGRITPAAVQNRNRGY